MANDPSKTPPVLGVVVVTFNSADVIEGCLESLLAATDIDLRVVVVDNASTDNTVDAVRAWADGEHAPSLPEDLPFAPKDIAKPIPLHETDGAVGPPHAGTVTLLHAGMNGGFASGVNHGLAYLAQDQEITRFWILNPDCVVPPDTPRAFAEYPEPEGGFALMGGRIQYLASPQLIQSDGGLIRHLTGVTVNVNRGKDPETAPPPGADRIDFICGASMVASRRFYEAVGPISEDYFLYFEEVDWALRRGRLPLLWCDSAPVYHHVGSSIGSGFLAKASNAFSVYFLYRSHMLFVRKNFPARLPIAYLWGVSKIVQLLLRTNWSQAYALLRAIHGRPPTAELCARLTPETFSMIFQKDHTANYEHQSEHASKHQER